MAADGRDPSLPREPRCGAVEVTVAAQPSLVAALTPLVAIFARLAGVNVRRARALAGEVVGLLAAAARGTEPVRLRLLSRPHSLRVRLQCGARSARALRRARLGRALNGCDIEAEGRNVLVLTLRGPFRSR